MRTIIPILLAIPAMASVNSGWGGELVEACAASRTIHQQADASHLQSGQSVRDDHGEPDDEWFRTLAEKAAARRTDDTPEVAAEIVKRCRHFVVGPPAYVPGRPLHVTLQDLRWLGLSHEPMELRVKGLWPGGGEFTLDVPGIDGMSYPGAHPLWRDGAFCLGAGPESGEPLRIRVDVVQRGSAGDHLFHSCETTLESKAVKSASAVSKPVADPAIGMELSTQARLYFYGEYPNIWVRVELPASCMSSDMTVAVRGGLWNGEILCASFSVGGFSQTSKNEGAFRPGAFDCDKAIVPCTVLCNESDWKILLSSEAARVSFETDPDLVLRNVRCRRYWSGRVVAELAKLLQHEPVLGR